jgi:C-terminal processing protease CtpA/Prc
VLVSRVIAGSPGELAGVHAGDVLASVDGNPCRTSRRRPPRWRASAARPVVLGLVRGHISLEVRAVRDRVIDPGVAVESIGDGFAYVRIEHFTSQRGPRGRPADSASSSPDARCGA